MTGEPTAVLKVEDLTVTFPSEGGDVPAVRGVSWTLREHEVLGVVGESGSGKSATALAIMGLLPDGARVGGAIRFRDRDLTALSEKQLATVRGKAVAMVFQDPMSSLNPVLSVGYQIAETLRAHDAGLGKADAVKRAIDLLELVGIPNASERVADYPHQFSGGMRQRVVLAIAMANNPDVILADEPTTALDVTIQAQVLEALRAARERTGAATVLITHDLGVVAGAADRVLVMYAGKIVESGTVEEVFYAPRMPYTLGLLGSLPRLDERRSVRLTPIAGSPTDRPRGGCAFAPRCPLARDLCRDEEPPLAPVDGTGHAAACHFSSELAGREPQDVFVPASTTLAERPEAPDADPGPLLVVDGLVKHYPVRGTGVLRRTSGHVHAVCDVSFELRAGETLGLVGESGSGKSTIGKVLMSLEHPTAGTVSFRGVPLRYRRGSATFRDRPRELQIVFQDPLGSLDPRMNAAALVAEPLRINGTNRATARARALELLSAVGLTRAQAQRYPHEFSGGQRQRIGVARALALEPDVLILDEPVSALDVSVQAGVINLLEDLQDSLGLSYLFVAHDLSVVRHIADRVAVMYLGRIVELGDRNDLFDAPAHPYTQALISAVPVPDPRKERTRERRVLTGEIPSTQHPPSGCRFRTRCPTFATELTDDERRPCVERVPQLVPRSTDHPVACHYPKELTLL